MLKRVLLIASFAAAHLAPCAWAEPLKDAAGGKDHPVVSRFQGSLLLSYGEMSYEEVDIPLGPYDFNNQSKGKSPSKSLRAAGKVYNYNYWAPAGRSDLEVFRNFQAALKAAGFKELYVCDKPEVCQKDRLWAYSAYWTGDRSDAFKGGYNALARMGDNSNYPPRFLAAQLERPSGTLSLGLVVTPGDSVTNNKGYGTRYFLQIVESAPMKTGQVAVNADAIQKGLKADGKIALYGLVFDTAKATLKPESKPVLDEMAKVLKADTALRVHIVGHTDNQGSFDSNLALSRQRAEAVIAALRAQYSIDAARLQAGGVADMAPVASNASEDGRSKNRRVEMVLR